MQAAAIKMIFILVAFFTSATRATETVQFPQDFQWCVATAGHQIEGDNIHSDWWAWEQLPGKIANGDRSGKASFHRERMEEDVQIMRNLGVKTYRFSVEWSRIEPTEGDFNDEAIAYYLKELRLLKENNIRPMVTLHHFVQPQWFTASGGWKRQDSPNLFLRYVKKVEEHFGAEVDYWVTFNEPMVLLFAGYGNGVFPPGETSWDFWEQKLNLLRAHAQAYRYMHEKARQRGQKIKIGMAHHLRPLKSTGFITEKFLPFVDYLLNWNIPVALKTGEVVGLKRIEILGVPLFPLKKKAVLDEIKDTQDFVGINYYTREAIHLNFKPPFIHRLPLEGLRASDLNWGLDPEGFYEVLKLAHQQFPEIPFYITENGISDSTDELRPEYILTHLRQLHKAMTELPHKIEGYCYWSLMDNFEWAEGFWPRFGLFEVEYENGGKRIVRPSALLIEKIFRTHALPDEI